MAGTHIASGKPAGRGVVDDPRTTHLKCLREKHLSAVKVGQTDIEVGSAPSGSRIEFEPTPGAAQQLQISDRIEGAEVIGSALLYPGGSSDHELATIEGCLAQGVSG